MKNRTLYTVLFVVCVICFWVFENFYTPDTYMTLIGDNSKTEVPLDYLPSSTTGHIVEHNHYVLSYAEAYEQAEWVAYTLHKNQLTYDDRKRPYFIEDPKVRSKSADLRNYKGSGYDRGHLCPAGDRRFSIYAYNETFYTSNITPQNNDFNAGIWNRLEQQARYWAKKYGTLYIVTGGVLENDLPSIGDEDVAVPRVFYKIIARGNKEELELIAFLLPHKESEASLQQYVVSVDRLERLTGINFFEKLTDSLEERVESKASLHAWEF